MANNFQEHQSNEDDAERTLEIRGTALVLAGILPPYITLATTLESCELVLENASSLVIKGH